jgi:hypothetical protein
MGRIPTPPYKIKKEFDKQAWRRDVASKCLIAMYGNSKDWADEHLLAKAFLNNVDALDKALEEKEKTIRKCLYCGKEIHPDQIYSYCNLSCYTKGHK